MDEPLLGSFNLWLFIIEMKWWSSEMYILNEMNGEAMEKQIHIYDGCKLGRSIPWRLCMWLWKTIYVECRYKLIITLNTMWLMEYIHIWIRFQSQWITTLKVIWLWENIIRLICKINRFTWNLIISAIMSIYDEFEWF